jgi:hypothetical protein
MRLQRRRERVASDEVKAAREETEKSTQQADADVEAQLRHLEEERRTLTPAFRQLREKNHVADALIEIIESSRE